MQSLSKEVSYLRLHNDTHVPGIGTVKKVLNVGEVGQLQVVRILKDETSFEITLKKQGVTIVAGMPITNAEIWLLVPDKPTKTFTTTDKTQTTATAKAGANTATTVTV